MELQTRNFDLYPSKDNYKVLVYDYMLARRVNRLLGSYKDHTFHEGEEAVFTFSKDYLSSVLKALKVKIPRSES